MSDESSEESTDTTEAIVEETGSETEDFELEPVEMLGRDGSVACVRVKFW